MPSKDKYTDPELREQVKEEIKESDKGGAPGQWSARKAQMMASEYKKRGGDYTTDKETGQDESQKNLEKWGEEDWQTKEGSGDAKKDDGSRKRYLPKKAWEQMDETEKEETDRKKQEASKEGRQFVGNTEKAKESRKNANEEEAEEFEEEKKKSQEQDGRQAKKDANESNKKAAEEQQSDNDEDEDKPGQEDAAEEVGEDEYEPEDDEEEEEREDEESEKDSGYDSTEKKSDSEANSGEKRGRGSKGNSKTRNKKQKADDGKTMGSKHDSAKEPAQKGSADRVPKQGQRVSWKAMPGWVHGTLEKIVTSQTQVEGKSVKADKDDPRFVLKADSGKICVHKPETCFYD